MADYTTPFKIVTWRLYLHSYIYRRLQKIEGDFAYFNSDFLFTYI
jgi:hypothetical protein